MPTITNGFDVTLSKKASQQNTANGQGRITVLIKNNTDEPVSLSATSPMQLVDTGGNLATLTTPTIDPSELTIAPGAELEKEIEIEGDTPDTDQTYAITMTINFDGGLPSVSGVLRGVIHTVGGGV